MNLIDHGIELLKKEIELKKGRKKRAYHDACQFLHRTFHPKIKSWVEEDGDTYILSIENICRVKFDGTSLIKVTWSDPSKRVWENIECIVLSDAGDNLDDFALRLAKYLEKEGLVKVEDEQTSTANNPTL